jgi:hypothetical protein
MTNFQVVILWDDRGDAHEIAVRGAASYEVAEAKAFAYGRNVLGLNVEGAGEGDVVTTISAGVTAIDADPTTDRNRFDAFGNPR